MKIYIIVENMYDYSRHPGDFINSVFKNEKEAKKVADKIKKETGQKPEIIIFDI